MLENMAVIIAIDFGTSRSGFAYAFLGDKEAHAFEDWPAAAARYPKTDTHLLYDPEGAVVAWGFEAMEKYAALRQNKKDQGYHFLANFKMALYEKADKTWDNQRLIFKDNQRILLKDNKEFVVIDLISDYLRCLKNFAIEKVIKPETIGLLREEQILWSLTVPAIWDNAEKQLMREAAIKAGLISRAESDADRLILVLEPESAAVYCSEKYTALSVTELHPGSRFMIIDAGGGTIDITVHEVVSSGGQNSLEEVVVGSGGAHGSTYVDDQFREYITRKLGVDAMQDILKNEPVAYRQLMSQWEERKCRFTGEEEDYVTFIYLQKIHNFLRKNHPEVLKQLAEQQDGTDDAFVLDNDLMRSLFRPVLDGVESDVEDQFALLVNNRPDFIFLVGGFSTSPLFRKRIQDKFGPRVKKIVMPSEPGAAIEMGAASLGLDPAVIRARRSRLSYGIAAVFPFEPGVDDESRKIPDPQGGFVCNRFACYIQAGEKVNFDRPVPDIFRPLHPNSRELLVKIYASRKQSIRYIDESGTQKIGELSLSRESINKGYDWIIAVTMYFGQSEIKIEAMDLETKEKVKMKVRFLTTYFPEFVEEG